MSRLLNPGFGDYLDRLSVLSLKLAHANGHDAAHFHAERDQIEQHVNGRPWTPVEQRRYQRLHQVNRELWTLVDLQAEGAAAWPRVSPEGIAELAESAVMTYRLNEERALIVRQLNGDGLEEKLR